MERHANYGLIGLATVGLFLGLLIFIVWLAGAQFTESYRLYDIVFVGPVQDFSEGAAVEFNGIKVGEVTRIVLDKANPKNVIAHARLSADVPIRQDSFATLEPQGITGVDHVQITAGTANRPLLADITPAGRTPVIASRPGALADLINGGGTVLSATVDALNRVNRVLSDENIKTFGATLDNARDFSAEVNRQKVLFADADTAVKSVSAAALSLERLSNSSRTLVDGDGRRTLKNAADAAEQIKAAAVETRTLVSHLQAPVGELAANGIPQLTSAIVTLREAGESLKRLTDEAEQSPQGLIAKAPAREVEIRR